MKLAIIGSRSFSNFNLLCVESDKLKPDCIVSGGAKGADTLAERYAELRGLPVEVIPAKWSDLSHPDALIKKNRFGQTYDARAGHRRNSEIVSRADAVLAFWDGESPGTRDSITKSKALGKQCVVVEFLKKKLRPLISERPRKLLPRLVDETQRLRIRQPQLLASTQWSMS